MTDNKLRALKPDALAMPQHRDKHYQDDRALEGTHKPPRETLQNKAPVLLVPALFFFLFLTFPGAYHALRPGLAASWHYAINTLPHSDYVYGRDVAFTYGPLGFLLHPLPIGDNLLLALGFRLILHVLLALAVLYYAFRVSGAIPALLFLLSYSFAIIMKLPAESAFLLITGLIVGISGQATKAARITVPLTSGFAALALFIKPTLAVSILAMVILAELVRLASGRTKVYRSLILVVGSYLLVAVPLSHMYFGTFEHFGTWLRATYEFTRHNSVALSLDGPRSVLLIALGLLWLHLTVTLILSLMKSRGFPLAFAFLPAILIAFKNGFDRQDAHVLLFFLLLLSTSATLILASSRIRDLGLSMAYFLVILLLTIPVTALHQGISYPDAVDLASGRTGWEYIEALTRLDEKQDELRTEAAKNLLSLQLPEEWTKLIQTNDGTVDALPWEINFCPANDLQWRPSPTVQSYVSYTAWLDDWNAQHFAGSAAPDFILLEWKNIDERHLAFDIPATWRSLLINYQLVDVRLDRDLILLARNQFPAEIRRQPLETRTVSTTSWIEVPHAEGPIFARFNPQFTREGRLARTVFRIPPITIELTYRNGETFTHRLIPDTAQNGLLISHVPMDAADAAQIFSGGSGSPVVRFRLGGPGAVYLHDTLDIEFTHAPAGVARIRQLALASIPSRTNQHISRHATAD